ncbi:MAG: hypothetical protein RR740_09025 [Pseudomonas sp.]
MDFNGEARKHFDFLLKVGMQSPQAELAEISFAEATGLVKYPFLAEQITTSEYDGLIAEVAAARQNRFSTLIQNFSRSQT